MKKLFLIILILTTNVSFAQVASYPLYLSPYDVAEWTMRTGFIASDSGIPTMTASEGNMYINIATPTIPVLWYYIDSAWRELGGGGGGGTSDHSLLTNLEFANSGHTGFASETALNDHMADQTDPHGASMTITQGVTVGSGTVDASITRLGEGTILIASFAALPYETATPTTIASDSVIFWAKDITATQPVWLYDGNNYRKIALLDEDENLDILGHVNQEKYGVFACLSTASTTTTTLASTYYPIQGTFTNDPLEGFSIGPGYIVYEDDHDEYFIIQYDATFSSDTNATSCIFGVYINGVLNTCSRMGVYAKTSGETSHVSGHTVVNLSASDTVQLVVQSDKAGAVLTINYFTTSITKFFN